MSCHYPICMMGGGNCPDIDECEAESREVKCRLEEKEKLDLEEQRLRIKALRLQCGEPNPPESEGENE